MRQPTSFDPEASWADGVITPAEGAAFVSDLGFVLVHGDRPDRPAGANLIVALRAHPTDRHFDPERIAYWATAGGHGVKRDLDRTTADPDARFSWGTIVVVDRLSVTNTFLTFGGTLRVGTVAGDERLAVFGSPAPIMRLGGHSQGTDVRAHEVGAFFGRLRAPLTAQSGAEATLCVTPPLALYAALIADVHARVEGSPTLRDARPGLVAWSNEALHHLESTAPDDLAAGRALLTTLAIHPG
ncbi:MAG: hypothetical protein WCH74_01680 [Chloroflexota bacterium]